MNWEILLVCGAALLAGAVNSVAGGGTLLTFPVLIAVLTRRLGDEKVAPSSPTKPARWRSSPAFAPPPGVTVGN